MHACKDRRRTRPYTNPNKLLGFRLAAQGTTDQPTQSMAINPIIGDTLAAPVTSIENEGIKAQLYNNTPIEISWKKSTEETIRLKKI